jgi:hypothetical protein
MQWRIFQVDRTSSFTILCAMHIESMPNRKSHPTILLRESYRADGKVKKRTRPWKNASCDMSDAACFPGVTVETPV